ncbi:Copia protein, partial [Durusdinium trenchii]
MDTPEAPIQDRARWRCLKCASFDASWTEDHWCCTACGSTDFYQVNQPTRQMTPEGTWLYVPNGGQADRTPRQWRRRQRRSGPPSDSQSELGERHPESETRTFDPAIDPDAPVNVASQPVDHQGDPPLPHLPPGSRGLPEQSPLSTVRDPLMKELRKLDATDLRAYTKYTKKVRIWELQMQPYASKADQALLLYNALSGEAEQELEHLTLEELCTDNGIEVILNMLKAPMEQRAIFQKRKYLHDFEHMKRYNGEHLRAYINRFRRAQRNLKSVGVDTTGTYDNESLGARLLDRRGLTPEQQRMLLVGTQRSLKFEYLAEAMVLQYPDFRPAPPIMGGKGDGREHRKGGARTTSSSSSSSLTPSTASSSCGKGYGGPKRAFFTEADETYGDEPLLESIEEHVHDENEPNDQDPEPEPEIDDSPQGDEDDPDSVDLAGLADVLTVTAKKLATSPLQEDGP